MYRYLTSLIIFFSACGSESASTNNNTQQHPRCVKSIVATTSEVVEKVYAGLSVPEMEVNLAFKVAGQILSIPISIGEEVAEGSTLAQLDPRDLELTMAADKSSYEQAKSSYERSIRLLKHEAISKQEAESAESIYTRAKSTYENSRDLLEQTVLIAPFKAVVERIYVQEFQRVMAGESVVRVVSPTTTRVSFTLPENSLSIMNDSSTNFKVQFDNYPGESFDAVVVEFARSSSDASGFPVTLSIENPAPSRFYINSGLSCSVIVSSTQQDLGAVVLPLSAIYSPTSGGTYVWVIKPDDHVELRKVELGKPVGTSSVVVDEGVDSGESIVVAGVYQLMNNQLVKVLK
ncbi:MAG: efflux RND transporter periplasmic adaptor subunit [Rikenellaceae bacterium]